MASNRAKIMRKRRSALLAAAVLALILIIVIIVIIVGIAKRGNQTVTPVATITPIPTALNTLAPFEDDENEFDVSESPEATASAQTGNKMYVTGDSVNVRKGASSTSDKIGSASKGDTVTVGELTNGFYAVTFSNGTTGYISKDYIAASAPTATASATAAATPDTSKGTKMYATESLNVRDAANTSGKLLKTLKKGDSITAYSLSGNWYYVQYASGKYGYASKSYLSTTAPAASATPTATAAAKTAINSWGEAGINVTWAEGEGSTSVGTRESYRANTGAQTPVNVGNVGGATCYSLKTLDNKTYYIAVSDGKANIYSSLDHIPGTPIK